MPRPTRIALPAAFAAAVLLLVGPPLLPQPSAARAQAPAPGEADAPALWEVMEQMGELLRETKQALDQPESVASAADTASRMQGLALTAKTMTPPKIAAMPEGDARDAQQLAYRTAMIGLTRHLLDLEAAALAGDKEQALAVIDKLVEARFQGHLKFKND